MRKIIILFLVCCLTLSLNSCNFFESDQSIMYNGMKYNKVPSLSGVVYVFNGEKQKIVEYTTDTFLTFPIYCLNFDIDKNILFKDHPNFGRTSMIWVKEGYTLPNKHTSIKSLQITNNNREEKDIELKENHKFTDIFVKIEEYPLSQYNEIVKDVDKYDCLEVTFSYEEYITCRVYIDLGDDGVLYLSVSDHSKLYYYKISEEYEQIFREHVVELKTEYNVEE